MEWYPKLCCNLKAPKAKKKCVPCSTGVTCQGRASHHQTSGLKHHCSESHLNRHFVQYFPQCKYQAQQGCSWVAEHCMTTAAVENQTLVAHVVSAPPNAFKRSGEEIKRVAAAPRGTFFFLFFFQNCTICWGSSESAGHFNCIPCPHSNSDHCVEA